VLDSRIRKAIVEFQQGRLSLEEAAALLIQVRRETGCLTLRPSPTAGTAERELIARFEELAAQDEATGT
jgi:hypothetical protein